ncbi:LUD domain-containing protein [Nocardia huaxiensis]|uniref:LUD domain-containing protein n=1 Tax=Nocardia huaxiensis TaxID=2755382 RepID=A0A7D6ZJQ6_9NOCA|nr:LUD domain-containing protein [Nocardia huaxiensis]QLY31320.1 LUD domain-containing protein [Nocardia huaxiensis]UFS94863.1 LUD domain-containing protein [Nocardia huaxiensis]
MAGHAFAAERPDREQLRNSAAAVKATVLQHLDTYLIQLERTVTEAGGTVHWAADAAAARRLVTALTRGRAAATRRAPRTKLLAAQVGITGANFLVAETGTVVAAESGGHGRLCRSVPETLICVAGVEAVVPTWRDLEIFLQLPVDAGERMPRYVSSWSGVTDRDGPREFHLILVDNVQLRAQDAGPTAREAILGRIRATLADLPPGARTVAVPREYLCHAPGIERHDREAVVSLFVDRVKNSSAQLHRVPSGALPETIASALQSHGARSVITPDGVPASWLSMWATESGNRVLADDPQLSTAEIRAVDAVLTGCAAAVADSGRVVLDDGPAQGRRAPVLIPGCHVCVVHAEQVASTLPEIIGLLDPERPHTWFGGCRRLTVIVVD